MQVSHAAIMELIKEADLLGSLRHPNVVWVYGIVLPPSNEHLLAKAASSDAVEMAAAAAMVRCALYLRQVSKLTWNIGLLVLCSL